MSKEESFKRVELKVNVNCCDGCKKKVLKALNIKGNHLITNCKFSDKISQTEIHPTLPKVTVTGTLDVGILIKKLAKCGKASELVLTDYIAQSTEKELKKNSTDSVKEASKEQTENGEKKKEIIKAEVSYSVNHGTVPAGLHLPEDFGVPMPSYSIVAKQCCSCGVPAVYQNFPPAMAPVSSPEGAGMADYFNDENTLGCYVM